MQAPKDPAGNSQLAHGVIPRCCVRGELMTPASSTASNKDVTLQRLPRLRGWPLLWTASFAVGVSLVLWVGIFLLVGWVLSHASAHT